MLLKNCFVYSISVTQDWRGQTPRITDNMPNIYSFAKFTENKNYSCYIIIF